MSEPPGLIISEAGSTASFMASYGRAMGSWGMVEHALCRTFLMLVRSPDPGPAGFAFFAIAGFRDRVNLVSALVDALLAERAEKRPATQLDEAIKAEWGKVLNAIGRTVKNRNRLAHLHFWVNGQGTPFGGENIHALGRLPIEWSAREKHVVTEKQMRDYQQGFIGLAQRLEAFADQSRFWLASP